MNKLNDEIDNNQMNRPNWNKESEMKNEVFYSGTRNQGKVEELKISPRQEWEGLKDPNGISGQLPKDYISFDETTGEAWKDMEKLIGSASYKPLTPDTKYEINVRYELGGKANPLPYVDFSNTGPYPITGTVIHFEDGTQEWVNNVIEMMELEGGADHYYVRTTTDNIATIYFLEDKWYIQEYFKKVE